MSSDTDTIDPTTIRRTVRQTLDAADDGVPRPDLVETVAAITDAPESDIADQLDDLEAAGFVHLVGEEVKKT
jgi:hypothetical protein